MSATTPTPDGHHAITVVFNVKGADAFIRFCTEAFAAEEMMRRPGPDGSVMHANLKLGDWTFVTHRAEGHGDSSGADP